MNMPASWKKRRALLTGVVLCLLLCSAASPQQSSSSSGDSGWLNLYDGQTLSGWHATGDWQLRGPILSSPMNKDRSIYTALPFGDFALKFDYRLNAVPSGACLRLRTTRDGQPADNGYRIPLGDALENWPVGSIVLRAHSPLQMPALNQWHSVEVEASGTQLKVTIDGQETADVIDESARAGYIGFEATRGSTLDLSNLQLKPLNVQPIFNGTDLAGWKSVPYVHPAASGMLKGFEHVFGGGGPGKPHNAKWTVHDNVIHGEAGPGALETTATYDDFVLQLTADATITRDRKDAIAAVYLRNQPGVLATGYPVEIGSGSGQIHGFATPRKAISEKGFVTETIVAAGRQIGIWVNGDLVTLYTDTRPDAQSSKQGAKTASGVISLNLPEDVDAVDYKAIALAPVGHVDGGLVKEIPVQTAAAAPASEPAASSKEADSTAQVAQIAAALGVPSPAARSKSAALMNQALSSDDPAEQMRLYQQVIQVDPSNAAAIQGYKEAQQRVAQAQEAQQQRQDQQQRQVVQTADRETQTQAALAQAQHFFLAGNLAVTSRMLQVAERLSPGNPVARDLQQRLNVAVGLRHRLIWLGGGAGLLCCGGLAVFLLRLRGGRRLAVLQVVEGLDTGRRYPLDQEVVRIGAVPRDGGQKNDIVVRDVERLVSRFHCEIHKQEGMFYLMDMNSSNGTCVDSANVEPGKLYPLRRGSIISLGGAVSLRFAYDRRKHA
jgi:hypothetical protein